MIRKVRYHDLIILRRNSRISRKRHQREEWEMKAKEGREEKWKFQSQEEKVHSDVLTIEHLRRCWHHCLFSSDRV